MLKTRTVMLSRVLLLGLAFCLCFVSIFTPMHAKASEGSVYEEAGGSPDIQGIQPGTALTVATPHAMSGRFATELWGNNTADMDVRALLHGYETVAWARNQSLELNQTVVSHVETLETMDGNSVKYQLTLKENLRYNDGSPITAADYAFYYLLCGAPEISEIGGATLGMSHVLGYDAYQSGEAKAIKGIRILSDYRLEIEMDASVFPYFYGLALLSAKPYPISQIAPGCKVADDGDGVYISNIDDSIVEPIFSAALLEETLLDPDTGYLSYPIVSSGPYALKSYDPENKVAVFTANEYFVGNYEGQTPHIEELTFCYVPESRMQDAYFSGEVDLLNKVADAQLMLELRTKQGPDTRMMRQASYLRTGFAFLAFACEESPTDSIAVRRAIAMSFDKDKLTADSMSGTALRAYGYYGLGQWMPTYATTETAELAGEEPLRMQDKLPALDVPMDLEAVAALLEQDGWTLNQEGDSFAPGEDTVRYRMVDGEMEPLLIKWAYAEDNAVADAILAAIQETWPLLGIGLEVDVIPFPDLLAQYYRQEERVYNMFFLASNFSYIFDPYFDFHVADAYQGMVNTSGIKDTALMELARDMRETDPMDLRTYVDKWFLFQERFVEMMPMVPLYSNVYFDFYLEKLDAYDITANSGWAYAILYASINENMEE